MYRNPKFGGHYYYKSHRFAYYVKGKPKYYFSDRPFTVEDARARRKRGLVAYGISSVIGLDLLIGGRQNPIIHDEFWTQVESALQNPFISDAQWIQVESLLLFLCAAVFFGYSIFKFIMELKMNPEENPMVKSFQCISDFERPREDTCVYCGGIYSRGAHEVCPHCGALIGDGDFESPHSGVSAFKKSNNKG